MESLERSRRVMICTTAALLLACGAVSLRPPVEAQSGPKLRGGPRGVVRSAAGTPLEGMMVQLISQKNSIRTTVYSNEQGQYEFPELPSGSYTLRIAKPLEFKPYQRDSITMEGSPKLDDIVLERVTNSQFLPPTPEILPQLTDAEWLWNLPGTAAEKRVFSTVCGSGCHNFQWPFRNRFDEQSWRLIVDRMTHYTGRLLVDRASYQPGSGMALQSEEDFETIVKWLAKVRGPEAKDPPMQVFQGPRGPATRVVVTEYEMPSVDDRPHDVMGDSKGYIWYTANRRPVIGRLDPRTGVIKEYTVPRTPGKHAGSHWLTVNSKGMIWFTETWSNNLVKFDPQTGEFHKMPGWGGNMGIAPDGFIWQTGGGKIHKIDPETGKSVMDYPLKKSAGGAYGNVVSPDGNFFAGGVPWQKDFDGVVFLDIRTGEVTEVETRTGTADPSRGAFDPEGNAWIGGRGGVLVRVDHKTHLVSEFTPPTPYVNLYEAKPDKNGEVWAGLLRGGRLGRFNPRTQQWIEYVLPEPYSLDWRTWVDNSTNPVTVWYGDHNGYLVRIQPLE